MPARLRVRLLLLVKIWAVIYGQHIVDFGAFGLWHAQDYILSHEPVMVTNRELLQYRLVEPCYTEPTTLRQDNVLCPLSTSLMTEIISADGHVDAHKWLHKGLIKGEYPVEYNMLVINLLRRSFSERNWDQVVAYAALLDTNFMSGELKAEVWFKTGYSLFKLKRTDSAVIMFKRATGEGVHTKWYAHAQFYLGYIHYLNGDWQEAWVELSSLTEHERYRGYIYYYLADMAFKRALQTGNYERFVGLADVALKYESAPASMRRLVLLEYAIANMRMNRPDKVKQALNRYIALGGVYMPSVRLWLAWYYLKEQNLDSAQIVLEPLLVLNDSISRLATLYQAWIYQSKGNVSWAIVAYRKLIGEHTPLQIRKIALWNYMYLAAQHGRYNEAIEACKLLLTSVDMTDVEKQEVLSVLPKLLLYTRNYVDAYRVLQSVFRLNVYFEKLFQEVAYYLALQYLTLDSLHLAYRLLDTVIAVSVDKSMVAKAYFWKGEILYRIGNKEGALRNYRAAIPHLSVSDFPENKIVALYGAGYVFLEWERYRECAVYFKRAVELWSKKSADIRVLPWVKDALLRLGDCYLMSGRYKEAYSAYVRYIKAGYKPADYALYQAGVVGTLLEETEAARTHFYSLIKRYPASRYRWEAEYKLAQIYIESGKEKEAIELLRSVADSSDGELRARAIAQLAILYYRLNQIDSSLGQVIRLMNEFPLLRNKYRYLLSIVQDVYVRRGQPESYFAFVRKYYQEVPEPHEFEEVLWESMNHAWQSDSCGKVIALGQKYFKRVGRGSYWLDVSYYMAECSFQEQIYDTALKYCELVLTYDTVSNLRRRRCMLRSAWILLTQKQDSVGAARYYLSALSGVESQASRYKILQTLVLLLSDYLSDSLKIAVARELMNNPRAVKFDSIHALELMADVLLKQGDTVKAYAYYEQLAGLTRFEPGVKARYFLAFISVRKNELTRAEKYVQEIINQTPAYEYWIARAYVLWGWIFYLRGDVHQAIATLQSVVENCPYDDVVDEARQYLEIIKSRESG